MAGNEDEVKSLTQQALDKEVKAKDTLNNGLLTGTATYRV